MGFPENFIAAIGDSLTYNTSLGVVADDFWPSQVQFALNGFGRTTAVSVIGSALTVAPGAGALFPVGCYVDVIPALPGAAEVQVSRTARWVATRYLVVNRTGDVLSLDRAAPASLISGVPVVGRGGTFATASAPGVADVAALNIGRSGDTTAGMLGRLPAAFVLGDVRIDPSVLIIQGGTNDTNAQGSTTTVGIGTNAGGRCTFAVQTGAAATVAGMCGPYGSYLTINGQSGWLVTAISGNTITAQPPAGTAASNLPAGTAVAVDTQNTLFQIVRAAQAYGVEHVFMATLPFKNFAGGGAHPTAPGSTVPLRDVQIAAAAQAGVPVLDAWEFMRARVYAGVDTMTDTYHVAAGDVHLNAYGNSVYAMAIAAGLQSAPGVMAALGAQRFDTAI